MAILGKGVEYALHCLIHLVGPEGSGQGQARTLASLAAYQGVSESYLAKVFTRLTKAGLVRSSVGAGGGYELARPAHQITFWDVVVAVEGGFRLFECREVRQTCVLYRDQHPKPDWLVGGTCGIHGVMQEAEAAAREALKERTLAWIAERVDSLVPPAERRATAQWFRQALK